MLYVAKGITMSTSLIIQLLIARTNGAANFGIMSLFLNISLIFSTLGDWGVGLNGPAMVLQANGQSWAALANYWRKRLSMLAGAGMALFLFLCYPALAPQMVWGLILVLGHGFLQDWYDRGLLQPDRSSYRQMLQGLLQVSAVAVIIFSGLGMHWVLVAYGGMAVFSYFIFYRRIDTSSFTDQEKISWLKQQFPVLAGWAFYYITYNIPALLLGYLFSPDTLGLYASHYFIYATVGTFSVITMDIFMAKPNDHSRKFWITLSSILGMLMILISQLYYPLLFGNKGFSWDPVLNMEMLVLCGILGLRLYHLNGLLMSGDTRAFGSWNALSLVLHLALIALVFIFMGKYGLWMAAAGLIMAEVLTLLLFFIKRKS